MCSDGGIDRAQEGLIQTHGSTNVHLELIWILSAYFGLKIERESLRLKTWKVKKVIQTYFPECWCPAFIHGLTSRLRPRLFTSEIPCWNLPLFMCGCCCVIAHTWLFICACLCVCKCLLAVGLLIFKGECMLKFKVGFPSRPFPLADGAPCRYACTLHTLCSLIH